MKENEKKSDGTYKKNFVPMSDEKILFPHGFADVVGDEEEKSDDR